MQWWLYFAKGPLFRFTFSLMIIGLLIQFIKLIAGTVSILKNSSNYRVPVSKVIINTLKWLFPLIKLQGKAIFSIISILFHVGLIAVPVFLFGHIELIRLSIGIHWPALNQTVADWLTIISFSAAFMIFLIRIFSRERRYLNRFQDYFLIFLIGFVFFSGYLTSHPEINPVPLNTTQLIHIFSGCLTFLLVPFSKLSHILLMPFTQLTAELAWQFKPEAGELVNQAIGKSEGEL